MVKETKKIDIKSALALCNITDEYEDFNKSLKTVMSKGNGVTDIYRLYRISIDEKIRDVKENKDLIKFYLQNEEAINKIKNYCPINDFVFNNYNMDGNLSEKSCITRSLSSCNIFSRNLSRPLPPVNQRAGIIKLIY